MFGPGLSQVGTRFQAVFDDLLGDGAEHHSCARETFAGKSDLLGQEIHRLLEPVFVALLADDSAYVDIGDQSLQRLLWAQEALEWRVRRKTRKVSHLARRLRIAGATLRPFLDPAKARLDRGAGPDESDIDFRRM